jgi:hypothetical protein
VLVIKDVTIVLNFYIICYFSRRGEEHSFILKPAIMSSRERKTNSDAPPALSLPTMTESTLNNHIPRVGQPYVAVGDQYAVVVSYRCNYTGKLFDKTNRFCETGMEWKVLIQPFYLCRFETFFQASNKLATLCS